MIKTVRMVPSKGGRKVVVMETVETKKESSDRGNSKGCKYIDDIVQAVKVINKVEMVEELKVDGW